MGRLSSLAIGAVLAGTVAGTTVKTPEVTEASFTSLPQSLQNVDLSLDFPDLQKNIQTRVASIVPEQTDTVAVAKEREISGYNETSVLLGDISMEECYVVQHVPGAKNPDAYKNVLLPLESYRKFLSSLEKLPKNQTPHQKEALRKHNDRLVDEIEQARKNAGYSYADMFYATGGVTSCSIPTKLI